MQAKDPVKQALSTESEGQSGERLGGRLNDPEISWAKRASDPVSPLFGKTLSGRSRGSVRSLGSGSDNGEEDTGAVDSAGVARKKSKKKVGRSQSQLSPRFPNRKLRRAHTSESSSPINSSSDESPKLQKPKSSNAESGSSDAKAGVHKSITRSATAESLPETGASGVAKVKSGDSSQLTPEESSSQTEGEGSSPVGLNKAPKLRDQVRKSSLLLTSVAAARRMSSQSRPSVSQKSEEKASFGKAQMTTEEQRVDWEVRATRVATVMFMSNAELSKGIKALEKEEVEEVAELFGLFDMDHSGSLDEQELGSLIRALGFRVNQEQILKMLMWINDEQMAEMAKDSGGKIRGRKSILKMVEEKAIDFDAFVQVMLRFRAEGIPKLDRKIVRPETVDAKGKALKQQLILLDALERVLPFLDDTWPVPKKKLKDADIATKACETLVQLSKECMKERDMLESLQSDLLIFKGQLQSQNKKGVQEINTVGGKHNELKQQNTKLTQELKTAQQELEKEKEKYKVLRSAAVPELAALDAEVCALRKRVESFEARVREDSKCARELAALQKAKESRMRELAPKVTQCGELQKKCEASYQVNVVLKSLLLECCANFDMFIEQKEAPLKRLESSALDVHTCIQGLIDTSRRLSHERLSHVSMVAPDGVPDPTMPAVTGSAN